MKISCVPDFANTRCLKKSAEKGYQPAYYHLGKMYYAGEGTKIDCEKAYFWLKKSADFSLNCSVVRCITSCATIGSMIVSIKMIKNGKDVKRKMNR